MEGLLGDPGKVMLIAPTGGGKSLCYQFPATELEGTSIVISPLIALMEDQVRALQQRGIPSTYIASTLDPEQRRHREQQLAEGAYKLVYIAPERLASGSMLGVIARVQPSLIAIDEAHCISQWGHDFRPSYLELSRLIDHIQPKRIIACTATATLVVREEIQARLGLQSSDTKVILRGFSRPNLHLSCLETENSVQRRSALTHALTTTLGSANAPTGGGIVYASTRKNTEKHADFLKSKGWNVAPYHAGLEASNRESTSQRFSEKQLDLVVATNAFGMGIDRDDIRAVVHVQAPGSVEAYYQEVGRAGRDGQPAHGLLLTSSSDFGLRRRLIGLGDPDNANPKRSQQLWRLFLDLMAYVEAGSCRHDFILRYFGDEKETLGGCGHCDVCQALEESGKDPNAASLSEAETLIIRKALSGVARNRGRAGMAAVTDMLHGADNDRMRKLGLDQLSTHGLLSSHTRPWIQALLRRLMTAGLVDLTPDEFPVPLLTSQGAQVMKGQTPIRIRFPAPDVGQRSAAKRAATTSTASTGKHSSRKTLPDLSEQDIILFEALRSTRMEIAKDKGVPAYVICHDRTLRDIAQKHPKNLEELGQAFGMGPARLESYGTQLLDTVKTARPTPA